MKSKFSKYNDGVVHIYREKLRMTDFNAKKNVSALENMDFIVRLDFEECAKREQDLEFALQNDYSLNLKIKTRLMNSVDNKCKAVIDGYLYDVRNIDTNRSEMWLYLEQVRKLNGGELA